MTEEQKLQMDALVREKKTRELTDEEKAILEKLISEYQAEQIGKAPEYGGVSYDDEFMKEMSSYADRGYKDPYKAAVEHRVKYAVKQAAEFQRAKDAFNNAKTEDEKAAAKAKMEELARYEKYSNARGIGYGPYVGGLSSEAKYLSEDHETATPVGGGDVIINGNGDYDPTYRFGRGSNNGYLARHISAEGKYKIHAPKPDGTYSWVDAPDGSNAFEDYLNYNGYEFDPNVGVWYSPKTGRFYYNDSNENGVFTDQKTKKPIERVNLKHTAPDLDAWRKAQEEKKKAAAEPAPAPGGGGDVPPGAVREEYKPIAQNTWKNDGSLASIAERRAAWQMA